MSRPVPAPRPAPAAAAAAAEVPQPIPAPRPAAAAAAVDAVPEESVIDRAQGLIEHCKELFDPIGRSKEHAFRVTAAKNACAKIIKSLETRIKRHGKTSDATKKQNEQDKISELLDTLDDEVVNRVTALRVKYKVPGFGAQPADEVRTPVPMPRVPDVGCPLEILPAKPSEAMYELVEQLCEKHAGKTPEYVNAVIKTKIVEVINRHAIHLVTEKKIMFALPDLASRNENGDKAYKYCTFPAAGQVGRIAWAQLWGTVDLPQLENPIECGTIWLTHRYHRQANAAVFQPPMQHDRPPVKDGHFNLYSGPAISLASAVAAGGRADSPIVEDWLQHCREMFPANGEKQLEAYHAWFAQILQQPGRKLPVSPVFSGLPGSGKTTAVMLPAKIIGMRYVSVPQKLEDLKDKFALARGKLLIFADELAYEGDAQTQNLLKRMVSDTASSGRGLYEEQSTFANYARLACAGNQDVIVRSEAGSRRWIVVQTRGGRRDLSRFYTPEALNDLAAYYYTRPCEIKLNFLESEANSHGILAGMSEGTGLQQFALFMLAERPSEFGTKRASGALYQIYTEWYRGQARFQKSKAVVHRELSKYLPFSFGGSKNARTLKLASHEDACAKFAQECARVPFDHLMSFIGGAEPEAKPAAAAAAQESETDSGLELSADERDQAQEPETRGFSAYGLGFSAAKAGQPENFKDSPDEVLRLLELAM